MIDRPLRIDQILPSFAGRDAIGTHVLLLRDNLRRRGFLSDIFAGNVGIEAGLREAGAIAHNEARAFSEYLLLNEPRSISIYHYSVGSEIAAALAAVDSFHVVSYHNITPHWYFDRVEETEAWVACQRGVQQASFLRDFVDCAWTVSAYNAQDLANMGIGPVFEFPIFRDYGELMRQELDVACEARVKLKYPNFLFVGRLSPNKAHHDLIIALKHYQTLFDRQARLFLVGSGSGFRVRRLRELADRLDLRWAELEDHSWMDADIVHVGSVTDSILATFYRSCDLFLGLSDHEGFGVPWVEAMAFGLPIVTHSCTAVAEVCADGAIRVDKRDVPQLISAMNAVIGDSKCRKSVIDAGKRHYGRYCLAAVQQQFEGVLEKTLSLYTKKIKAKSS